MYKAVRRLLALTVTCMLLATPALADIAWPEAVSPAQTALQDYITRVNEGLAASGTKQINALFELYPTFAVLGISSDPTTMIPEGVEMTVTMHQDTLDTLELRVNDPALFATLAGACISSVNASIVPENARQYAQNYANRALNAPFSAFEEEPDLTNSATVKAYFAYYPDLFHDGENWLQMTIVFPLGGVDASFAGATPTPAPADETPAYEGYMDDAYQEDGMTHFEVFVTPTPEPDSPAGEAW